jgi:hypothetical protein
LASITFVHLIAVTSVTFRYQISFIPLPRMVVLAR